MNPAELEVLIHGRHTLTIDMERARACADDPHTGWRNLTAVQNSTPNSPRRWLTALLPENGNITWYALRAAKAAREHDLSPLGMEHLPSLWASPDAEYPGAVSFKSICSDPQPPEYRPISDNQIKHRIHAANLSSIRPWRGRPKRYPGRLVSLAGMRPKFGLAWISGQWHTAHGTALTDWIVKSEFSHELPGEAGIESLCQRTLPLLGVPAAETCTRMFKKLQCVLSRRFDRADDPGTRFSAIHQEDFAQATGWPSWRKYDQGTEEEPRWEAAYALLRRYATDPEDEQKRLTRLLAATWVLGHSDLHRRNLGFVHEPADNPPRIRLAPAYDTSSTIGTRFKPSLAIGIAGKTDPEQIGPDDWIEHARRCGVDPGHTLSLVREIVRNTPEALAAARETARAFDEHCEQDDVDRRAEALMRHAEKRKKNLQITAGDATPLVAHQDTARAHHHGGNPALKQFFAHAPPPGSETAAWHDLPEHPDRNRKARSPVLARAYRSRRARPPRRPAPRRRDVHTGVPEPTEGLPRTGRPLHRRRTARHRAVRARSSAGSSPSPSPAPTPALRTAPTAARRPSRRDSRSSPAASTSPPSTRPGGKPSPSRPSSPKPL